MDKTQLIEKLTQFETDDEEITLTLSDRTITGKIKAGNEDAMMIQPRAVEVPVDQGWTSRFPFSMTTKVTSTTRMEEQAFEWIMLFEIKDIQKAG